MAATKVAVPKCRGPAGDVVLDGPEYLVAASPKGRRVLLVEQVLQVPSAEVILTHGPSPASRPPSRTGPPRFPRLCDSARRPLPQSGTALALVVAAGAAAAPRIIESPDQKAGTISSTPRIPRTSVRPPALSLRRPRTTTRGRGSTPRADRTRTTTLNSAPVAPEPSVVRLLDSYLVAQVRTASSARRFRVTTTPSQVRTNSWVTSEMTASRGTGRDVVLAGKGDNSAPFLPVRATASQWVVRRAGRSIGRGGCGWLRRVERVGQLGDGRVRVRRVRG